MAIRPGGSAGGSAPDEFCSGGGLPNGFVAVFAMVAVSEALTLADRLGVDQ
jgi:hypothetical protein